MITMAEYLVLIYQDERVMAPSAGPGPMMQAHQDFIAANQATLRGGEALERGGSAASIRPDGAGGFVVTDGPFLETKETLGGYYLIEAADLDAAIAIAKHVPMAGGGVEVRPIRVFG
jgi:hypothetical protein